MIPLRVPFCCPVILPSVLSLLSLLSSLALPLSLMGFLFALTTSAIIARKKRIILRLNQNIMQRRIQKVALILLISHASVYIAGYVTRNIQLAARTEKLKNVLVIKDFGNNSYRLEFQGTRFNAKFDKLSMLDWKAGQMMKFLAYEQKAGYKTVVGNNLGFEFYTDENGNRIIFQVKGESESDRLREEARR